MVKAQKWLEEYYSDKEATWRIDIKQQLEGDLDCREYKKLEYIFISTSVDKSKFEIKGGSYKNQEEEIKETKIIACILAQTWLDQKYPTLEERKNIKELDLRNLNLEGDLDLAGFPSHLKVYLAGNPHLGKIKNKTHWTKLIYQNPQEFLDYLSYNKNQLEKIDLEGLDFDKSSKFELILDNYPQLKEIDGNFIDSSIIKITISNCSQLEEVCVGYSKSLKTLNLNNLPNLKKLDCRENNLTILDLTNFTNLERLECFNNRLTEIKLPKGEKLEYLHLGRNNFNQDLSFLKDLVNLKELYLFGNKFTGSLKPLKDLNKLEWLKIFGTNIDSGLEYLSDSIEVFELGGTGVRKEWKEYFKEDLKKLKEFNGSAQQWLNENYPENEGCKISGENRSKKREQITNLDISYDEINKDRGSRDKPKIQLKKGLTLKGFTNLKILNCSGHQITSLDLSDCSNLVELKCNGNQIKANNLNFLAPLNNLKELDLNNCGKDLKGSLKSLEKLKQLEKVSISHTGISEGLEDLPESCKKINCELDYDYSSVEIAKQLSKFSREGKCDDLDKWRIDQANNATVSIIPLERLLVIRSNIRKFVNKWSKEAENKWYEKFWGSQVLVTNQTNNQNLVPKVNNKLSRLQNPEELNNHWYAFAVAQYANRAVSVAGGVALVYDYSREGGWVAVVCPFIETGISYAREEFYDAKEKRWNEFIADSEELLENYHELLGMIDKITIGKLGEVNESLSKLDETVDKFLVSYDKNEDGSIVISELIENRKNLAQDLSEEKSEGGGSKLGNIVEAIKKLEEEIIKYQQGSSSQDKAVVKSKEKRKQKHDSVGKIQVAIKNPQEESSQQASERTPLLETKIQVPDKPFNK